MGAFRATPGWPWLTATVHPGVNSVPGTSDAEVTGPDYHPIIG